MAVRRSHADDQINRSLNQVELSAAPLSYQEQSQTLRETFCRNEEDPPQKSLIHRVIKWISLCIVALCLLTATVLSKVSLVNITGRMFHLSNASSNARSVLFIQLVFLMLIPEVISFFRCLFWGVIGKTTKKFPLPSKDAVFWGFVTTLIEVAALCGFVFGVACRLPPSLTILLLNGCFSFPIGYYLIVGKLRKLCPRTRDNYQNLSEGNDEEHNDGQNNEQQTSNKCIRKLLTFFEILGFLVQLGVVVAAIPALSLQEKALTKPVITVIIMVLSLVLISFVWSGWIQQKVSKSYGETRPCSARLKAGLLTSTLRIFLIPIVSYFYASLILDFNITTLHSHNFVWHGHELSTFLTHVLVSFVAFVFAWIASALQSWAFLIPMLLSTPISFGWCVEIDGVFPFVGEYLVDWKIEWFVLVVASLLWISQYLAFSYHIFQNSDNVLTNDADLFWMPRYNSVFLEQHLVLNRKTAITGYSSKYNNVIQQRISQLSKNNYVFICSTMYHENEVEMKQLLKSINRIAMSIAEQNKRNHKYESHIFFDNACSDEHINKWVMQLLGLLESTLGIKPDNKLKLITPYGIQLRYELEGNEMPFYIHLKDNSKVKRKKRWSQVMYMNYIINYRMKKDNADIMKEKAFILTTDADIDFTDGSVIALLDILARDDGVGAVCARTHPLGSGPVVWYQIFDYAIGHWLQKAAEHILGTVLCCPGCFSVFRISALEQVLDTFGTSVENGYDFITKDMGEDRWLCTLLIQKGWRLEYSAVSQDRTYCPESFEELYKQRRRWITSTLANISLVIGNSTSITKNNDSVTILYMFYQLLIVFSTLISPATVIILIVIGLKAVHVHLDDIALVVVLSIVSVSFGALCLYATEKTQLMVAKFLTFIFSIIMAVVISGIVTNSINSVVDGNPYKHQNDTVSNFQFPVDISAVFTSTIILIFVIAGVFHISEFYCVFHMFWYWICLPSAYLFLIIYSVCNINNEKWGTREEANPKDIKSQNWIDYFIGLWHKFVGLLRRCIKRRPSTDPIELIPPYDFTDHIVDDLHPYVELRPEVKEWLRETKCDKFYADNFEKEGYTEMDFVAMMTTEDFEAIGIEKRGFQLKLEKEVNKLPTPDIETNVPEDVAQWLRNLKLPQYEELFESEGYSTDEDVENLKGLTEKHLRKMGITRRVEIRINKTRVRMDKVDRVDLFKGGENDAKEHKFWKKLANQKLKPESSNLGKVREVKDDLKELRNYVLLVLLLANVMWIAFLYSLTFRKLEKYNLPKRAFSLFFLIVFAIIVLIQFIAMICHRFVTLLHLLAGIKPTNNGRYIWIPGDDVEVVTKRNSYVTEL
ncbi:chitin synthase chs-2-like isoform X2 [Dysidea avara]|uniref:chitin synthase chs-2-like isoform X2 n=1 Tax=Dysidea avara TaxID=196820 RepID=UPI0033342ED7